MVYPIHKSTLYIFCLIFFKCLTDLCSRDNEVERIYIEHLRDDIYIILEMTYDQILNRIQGDPKKHGLAF